jgi:hypothetical protein
MNAAHRMDPACAARSPDLPPIPPSQPPGETLDNSGIANASLPIEIASDGTTCLFCSAPAVLTLDLGQRRVWACLDCWDPYGTIMELTDPGRLDYRPLAAAR